MTSISIVFVMDASGSMVRFEDTPWMSLNDFIQEQKQYSEKNPDIEIVFTLIFFNDTVNIVYQNKPIREVELLTKEDYRPSSLTALHDAIGSAIDTQLETKYDKVVIAIFTDGEENMSVKYTQNDIKKFTKETKILGWRYIYMGTNHDVTKVSSDLGIYISSKCEYTSKGMYSVIRFASQEVQN